MLEFPKLLILRLLAMIGVVSSSCGGGGEGRGGEGRGGEGRGIHCNILGGVVPPKTLKLILFPI